MSVSATAGSLWGGIVAVAFVPFVLLEAMFIGFFWGLCCSFVPSLAFINKPLAVAVPLWLCATTIVLIVTLPFDNLLLSFVGSTAAYVIVCLVLQQSLLDELSEGPDRSRCENCGYSRTGLPTNTCPECGHMSKTDPPGPMDNHNPRQS